MSVVDEQAVDALYAEHAARRLSELARASDAPARVVTVRLTAAKPACVVRQSGRSVGVYNPTGARVYIGAAGESVNARGASPVCPPYSLLVLPLALDMPELGCNTADVAAGDVVVLAFFFDSVQPALLAGL